MSNILRLLSFAPPLILAPQSWKQVWVRKRSRSVALFFFVYCQEGGSDHVSQANNSAASTQHANVPLIRAITSRYMNRSSDRKRDSSTSSC